MNEEFIKQYGVLGGSILITFIAGLFAWMKASQTRTNVSGDNFRRAADQTMLDANTQLRKDNSELRARNEVLEHYKTLHDLQQVRIKRLERRVREILEIASEEGADDRVLRAYRNTDLGDLSDD